MNIPTKLQALREDDPRIEETTGKDAGEQQHEMVVRLEENFIIVEDANWVLIDEEGRRVHSVPTFRVMLGAEQDGVHLYVWQQTGELDPEPDLIFYLAGWSHGQNPALQGQGSHPDTGGGDPDGQGGGLQERYLHIGGNDPQVREDEG